MVISPACSGEETDGFITIDIVRSDNLYTLLSEEDNKPGDVVRISLESY